MSKEDWVGADGDQYKTKEEYERALGYYVCMHCGGDLPEQWVKGWCESCAQQLNDDFEEVKRTEAKETGK